jgi:tRNA threonylcarbamoyl adenosine modification protein (Sua5/YciO/YrdC/YwlC family)
MAVTLQIDAEHPQPRHIARAVEVLGKGGIIAYPTDTSYGLGCDLYDKRAIEKVYQLKRMGKQHQLSFICADLSNVAEYAVISDFAYRTMKRLLPGPYTFILPATKVVPKFMLTEKRKTVGIRVPDHPAPRAIVEQLGHPIITTTAGFEGEEPFASASQIAEGMGKAIDLILDSGILHFDESSVIDLSGEAPIVIREGKGDVSLFT